MFELSLFLSATISGMISTYAVAKIKKLSGIVTYLQVSLVSGFAGGFCLLSLIFLPLWVACILTAYFVLLAIHNCHELYKKRHPET